MLECDENRARHLLTQNNWDFELSVSYHFNNPNGIAAAASNVAAQP
jgi:hypothetical protein